MRPSIPVAVISETPVYREGLSSLLGRTPPFKVVFQGNFRDFGERGVGESEVLVLDVGTVADQGEAQNFLSASQPSQPVVVVGIGEHLDEVLGWLEAGAFGFVSRREGKEALIEAVRNAAAGKLQCSPEISGGLLKWGHRLEQAATVDLDRLTNREAEIYALKALRLTNQEIATRLNIAVSTVKNHLHNIREKERERHSTEPNPSYS